MEQNNINDILGIEPSKSQINNTPNTNRHRYPALSIISGLYNAFAWIIGVVAIIVSLVFFSKGEEGTIIAVSVLISGVLAFIGLLAMSELIKLFIDIEYNTRSSDNRK